MCCTYHFTVVVRQRYNLMLDLDHVRLADLLLYFHFKLTQIELIGLRVLDCERYRAARGRQVVSIYFDEQFHNVLFAIFLYQV